MRDLAIRAERLSKVYRLYSKPRYRVYDMLGLFRKKDGYTEHPALDGISLEIRRGEKVAIIGRNGAGKSTFLKLVTNVIVPSSGTITVHGEVHALLQIGTGFHPDFTGRENVYAYLAHQGISGRDADRNCAEIIDFAELEEYIDQPMKTYSTGMAVRLMFATSTAISPDVLVIDEVLGVGDAYFARKSYDRIRRLCDKQGTTLLLVTHDIYSAAQVSDRMIWIDRGRILMDGDGETVVKAYEDSIRAQEERRLRLRTQERLKSLTAEPRTAGRREHLLFEIRAKDNKPQPSSVYFSRIELVEDGQPVASLPLATDSFSDEAGSHLEREGGCWGDAVEWRGRICRPMLNYGSSFHKVMGVFEVPEGALAGNGAPGVAIDYWSDQPCELVLRCFVGDRRLDLGELPPAAGEWATHTAVWAPESDTLAAPASLEISPAGAHGAGNIMITDVTITDADGEEIYSVRHGAPMTVRIRFRIIKKNLRENAQVFVVVSRQQTERICKFMTSDLTFDEAAMREGIVEMHWPKVMLSRGEYSLAVEIAAPGYVEKGMTTFYSIDPDVYHCLTHALDFTVVDSGWMGDGTVFEGAGEWSIRERPR